MELGCVEPGDEGRSIHDDVWPREEQVGASAADPQHSISTVVIPNPDQLEKSQVALALVIWQGCM